MIELSISIVVVLLIGALTKVYAANRRLFKCCEDLENNIEQIKRDMAGLCASAVAVDKRLYLSEERFCDLFGRLENYDHDKEHGSSYQSAIELAKSGQNPGHLMDECGFSRGEAELMVRLYGKGNTQGRVFPDSN